MDGDAERAPRVSIGLPVYNGEEYLGEAIESLLIQDFDDFEVLIGDNASTDRSRLIAEAYAARDDRIRVYTSSINRGAAWNFNRLLRAANGELFKWAAHDDVYESTYIRRCVEILDRRPDVVLCHSATVDIDEKGRELSKWAAAGFCGSADVSDRFEDVILRAGPCLHAFGLMRSGIAKHSRGIGSFSSSDIPFLAELALAGPFAEVPEPLFLHREHAGRSINTYGRDRVRGEWFDPALAGKVTFPIWRLGWEYVKLVAEFRGRMRDRLLLLKVVARWALAYTDRAVRELAWGVLQHVRRIPFQRLPERGS